VLLYCLAIPKSLINKSEQNTKGGKEIGPYFHSIVFVDLEFVGVRTKSIENEKKNYQNVSCSKISVNNFLF